MVEMKEERYAGKVEGKFVPRRSGHFGNTVRRFGKSSRQRGEKKGRAAVNSFAAQRAT